MNVNTKIFVIFAMSFCLLKALWVITCGGTHTY